MEVVVKIQYGMFWYLPVVLLIPLGGSLDHTKKSADRNDAEFYKGTVKHTVLV
jgi:hypothetical protein